MPPPKKSGSKLIQKILSSPHCKTSMPATRTYSPLLPKIPPGTAFAQIRVTRGSLTRARAPTACVWARVLEPCRPTACISAAPFRHTRSHPRPTTTVWRNLQQHPQCAATTTTLHSPFSILNSSFSYTFSAKERDSETGLSYFGARYYSSDLSIWLSVDPQAAKYPHQSNYVYCSNNPLKVIDPNGEDEWEIDNSAARLLQVFIHTLTNPIIISQKRIHCMEIEDI